MTNWEDSWISPDGWKRFSQSETIMRGWQQASTMNLEENRARLKINSSSVFKWWEWQRETPPRIIEAHRKNQKRRGWANYEKNLKDLGEKHLTDDNSFLRQTSKRILRTSPGELEESGKILGKDLWVRAHSKEHRWKDLKEMLHRLN